MAPYVSLSTDGKTAGGDVRAGILMAYIFQDFEGIAVQIQGFLEAWIQGSQSVAYTPSGLAYLSPWGSLRHTSNAALIAAVYANLVSSTLTKP